MKRKHLIAALITVAVIVGSLAFPAFAEATQTAEDPANSAASQDSVSDSSAPVSYTHLDVYKRQV